MNRQELVDILGKGPALLLDLPDEGERARSIELLWGLALDEREAKPLRKTAKKALYMLKSRGADVERHRPAAPAARGGAETDDAAREVTGAYLSLPDSSMSSLVLILLSGGSGASSTLCQAVTHPERGIEKLSFRKSSGKQLEKYLELNPEVFGVPFDYAVFRFGEALRRTDRKSVSGLESLPAPLRGENDAEVVHPALALAGAQMSRILHPEEERKLFGLHEVARLSLVGGEVQACRERVREARQSRLIVGNRSPEERVSAVIDHFVTSHFTPERRRVYAALLFDIALYFAGAGMRDEARALVGYGRDLHSAGPSLGEHPIVRFLVYKEFLREQ
jgi:hypothetical protein